VLGHGSFLLASTGEAVLSLPNGWLASQTRQAGLRAADAQRRDTAVSGTVETLPPFSQRTLAVPA
jgi:hypothetical protein